MSQLMAVPSNRIPDTETRITSLEQPRLCQPCKEALISSRGNWWRRFKCHIPRIYSLTKFGQRSLPSQSYICRPYLNDDCFLCWLIVRAPKRDIFDHLRMTNELGRRPLNTNIEWLPTTWAGYRTTEAFSVSMGFTVIKLKIMSAQDPLKRRMTDTTMNSSYTWSPEAASRARRWLGNCRNQHPSCSLVLGRAQTRYIPKRVIKVEKDAMQGLKARLLLGTSAPPDLQYLTLSHCWGGLEFLTLTMDHVNSFLQQIPVSDDRFNRTFLDAFNVTLDLGYEYIWIDSLCIIQDSPGASDWNDECPQVGSIYANGVCNLSATGFKNGATGMFNKRNINTTAPCPITFPYRATKYLATDVLPFDGPETEYPLLSRAWVLQEHALSPRTLHFLPTQICWTYCSTTDYELKFHLGFIPLNMVYYDIRVFKGMFRPIQIITENSNSTKNSLGELHQNWSTFVHRASKTRLTLSSDRLPCLSGIASLLQPMLQTRYVAGHWESNLLESLTWLCDLRADDAPYAGYIAPSWSWASASWPVYRYSLHHGLASFSQVVEINVTHTGTDKFGALSDAYLRMRGPVVEGITGIKESGLVAGSYSGIITVHGDIRLHINVYPDKRNSLPLGPDQAHRRQPGALPAAPSLLLLRTLRFLPLLLDKPNDNPGILNGLVVEQVESRSDGAFKRVGAFATTSETRYYLQLAAFLSAISDLPVEEYKII